jgi:hypothetical protein
LFEFYFIYLLIILCAKIEKEFDAVKMEQRFVSAQKQEGKDLSRRFCTRCHTISFLHNQNVKQDTSKPRECGQFFYYDEQFSCEFCKSGKDFLNAPGFGSPSCIFQFYWNTFEGFS